MKDPSITSDIYKVNPSIRVIMKDSQKRKPYEQLDISSFISKLTTKLQETKQCNTYWG